MSRHTHHSEENFWPCVSDMFLALFVIALLMHSQVSKKKGDGDLQIADQAATVAIDLIEELHGAIPKDEHILGAYDKIEAIHREVQDKREKTDLERPKLAAAVYELTQSEALRFTADDDEKGRQEKKYTVAIRNLYKKACGDGHEQNYTADEQLRQAGKAMLKRCDAKVPNGAGRIELEKCLNEANQRNRILTEENQRLSTQIQELEDKLKNQKEPEERILNLEQQLTATGGTDIGVLMAANADLKKKLAEIKSKDIRALVMSRVEEKVAKYGLQDKVKIEKALGVLRIPSDSVGFKQDEDAVSHGKEVLKKLSDMLIDIADENIRNKQIDNIVIECHADTTGEFWNNEDISSRRALNVWRELNSNNKKRLLEFKNSQGLGLFSHAGFGARVPLQRQPDEKSNDWWKRCRRIDIRFNCTPMGSDNDTSNL